MSIALGFTAPVYLFFDSLKWLGGELFLIWQDHARRIVAVAILGYFAVIIFNSMRRFTYQSYGFDPFTQFEEDKPFGSAEFATFSDLSAALNGAHLQKEPEFKE